MALRAGAVVLRPPLLDLLGQEAAPLPNVPTAATRVASASAAASAAAGNANANANTIAPTGPSSGLNSDLSSGPNAPRAPPCDRR